MGITYSHGIIPLGVHIRRVRRRYGIAHGLSFEKFVSYRGKLQARVSRSYRLAGRDR